MKLRAEYEEERRINLVKFLDGTQRSCLDITEFDGHVEPHNVPAYIKRLRARGIKICTVTRGKFITYLLDMPLDEAITAAHRKIQPTYTTKKGIVRKSRAWAAERAMKREQKKQIDRFVPKGDAHPWWGIITRSEPIDCRLPS